jgi:hypothetical protein
VVVGWVVVDVDVVDVEGRVVVDVPTTTVVVGDRGGKVGTGEKLGSAVVVVVVANGRPRVVVVGSAAEASASTVVVVSNKPMPPTPAPPGSRVIGSSLAIASASHPNPDTTPSMSPPARAMSMRPATALVPRNLMRFETTGSVGP